MKHLGPLMLLFVLPAAQAAEIWEQVWERSKLPSAGLKILQAGEVTTARRPIPSLPEIMVVASVYYLPLSPEKAAAALAAWNPSRHEALGVQAHHASVSGLLDAAGKNPRGQALLDKARGFSSGGFPFHLSKQEAEEISKLAKERPAEALGKILETRASTFREKGLDGLPPYEKPGPVWRPGKAARRCFQASPEITRQFHDLLLQGIEGNSSLPGMRRNDYAEILEVRREPTLLLGSYLSAPASDGWQVIDFQHYLSGGFYGAVVCYQLWEAGPGSVVWRIDHVFVPDDYGRKGVAAMAGDKLLALEVKKAIALFQQDCR